MAVIKCKMCGGDIELAPDKTFGTCEYCGSTMTMPKIDSEQRAAAFNRGNHFRRMGEFDKALAVYERIVADNDHDAEAHWCCALCRFGIEYVEDPATYEYLPTCHRASFDSFLEDVDYLAAVENSDGITRRQYQKDAAKIAEVQKGILATSQNEKPFDVFICYKETNADGQRTRDSLMAQDIYYQLTEQGFRVFFSRITLEDKAGTEYEPYIFAALNSSRVMVVVGTCPEHFNAVWVKNEWSRFLALMRQDRNKLLLPCYRDMDPYDLPDQLSVLQSYNMDRIGFMQDLIRGISKVLTKETVKPAPVKETVVVQHDGANTNALLKRGNMSLADEEWDKADNFFEEVLNQDAECSEAYLGKALAELQYSTLSDYMEKLTRPVTETTPIPVPVPANQEHIDEIVNRYAVHGYLGKAEIQPFYEYGGTITSRVPSQEQWNQAVRQAVQSNRNLQRAIQFSKEKASEISRFEQELKQKLEQNLADAKTEEAHLRKEKMEEYHQKQDAADVAAEELYQKTVSRKAQQYQELVDTLKQDQNPAVLEWKLTDLEQRFRDYQDSEKVAEACRSRIQELKAAEAMVKQRKQKRMRRITAIVLVVVVTSLTATLLLTKIILPRWHYQAAMETLKNKDQRGAAAELIQCNGYGDAAEKLRRLMTQTTLLAGSYHTVGLHTDGTVVAVGANEHGQCNVSDWLDIISVSTGCFYTVGLKADGTVVVTGDKDIDQYDVFEWENIAAISASAGLTVGLKLDGTVVTTGNHGLWKCDVSDWTDIAAVCSGDDHIVGIKLDGTVVATGDQWYGQCDTSDWTDIVAVSTGYNYTVGLRSDGTVVATEYRLDDRCSVSDWKHIVAISAGKCHTIGLKSDGTVVATGDNSYGQCNIADWTDIVSISAGDYYTVGLKADGTAVATGNNDSGQCDVSDWKDIKMP